MQPEYTPERPALSVGAGAHSGVDAGDGQRTWPRDGLERVPSCPVCGCERRSLVHRGLTDRVFFCAPGSWEMHRCERCGSCYLDPRPTAATIHLAYERYFTHAETGISQGEAALTGLKKLRRSWANGYRNWRYGTQSHPASRLGIWAAMLIPSLRRAADSRMRFIPRASRGRRLLDVGAGNGAYLLQARAAGWNVLGVEPDAAAISAARSAGLDVRQGGIDSLAEERGSIDVITMNHVIEHVHDPRAVLGTAFELLGPGGLLFLETPSVTSSGHKLFGRHWRGLEPPRHLVLFNWNSLEGLLREVGFGRIERLRRSGVYPTLAAKSRAIRDGVDPEAVGKPTPSVLMADTLREIGSIFDYRRAEFITLLAEKR